MFDWDAHLERKQCLALWIAFFSQIVHVLYNVKPV